MDTDTGPIQPLLDLHYGIWHTILRFMTQLAEPDLDAETLHLLGEVSTATLTTQLFKLGLRNAFLYGLRPLNPSAARMVGPAFTLRYIPAREDIDIIESFENPAHPQRLAVETAPKGSVLVMDCRMNGRAASAGEVLMTRLFERGVSGVVTDGSVRDSPSIAAMTRPVFVQGVSATPNLALHHAVDMNVPIGCAGVPVFPGDIMVADGEGVVCVPRHLVRTIAQPAGEQERLEAFLLKRVAAGAALPGTYPPNAETLKAYRASR